MPFQKTKRYFDFFWSSFCFEFVYNEFHKFFLIFEWFTLLGYSEWYALCMYIEPKISLQRRQWQKKTRMYQNLNEYFLEWIFIARTNSFINKVNSSDMFNHYAYKQTEYTELMFNNGVYVCSKLRMSSHP